MILSTVLAVTARASDHLDSPATVANPRADIADVYAWTSPEGGRLNLVTAIQSHTFSDRVDYVVHERSPMSCGVLITRASSCWRIGATAVDHQ